MIRRMKVTVSPGAGRLLLVGHGPETVLQVVVLHRREGLNRTVTAMVVGENESFGRYDLARTTVTENDDRILERSVIHRIDIFGRGGSPWLSYPRCSSSEDRAAATYPRLQRQSAIRLPQPGIKSVFSSLLKMFVYLVYKKYIVEFLCSHFIRPAPHPPNRIGTPHSLRSFPCSLFSPFAATGQAGSPSFPLFGRRPEIRRSASVTAQAVRPEDRPPASEKTT